MNFDDYTMACALLGEARVELLKFQNLLEEEMKLTKALRAEVEMLRKGIIGPRAETSYHGD